MRLIIVLVTTTLLFVQCIKEDDLQNYPVYNFQNTLQINYNADTIPTGDTLWLDSEVFSYLNDSATQKNIFFSDAQINLNLMIRSWSADNQTYQPDCHNFSFQAYTHYVSYTNNVTMASLYYIKSEGKYELKVGVVFLKPGIYSIDTDYLKFNNYHTNQVESYGGGFIQFYDIDNNFGQGNIKTIVVSDDRNLHLYNNLSDIEKGFYDEIIGVNQQKYFFIKVNTR